MSVPARRSDCVGILWKNKIKSLSQPRHEPSPANSFERSQAMAKMDGSPMLPKLNKSRINTFLWWRWWDRNFPSKKIVFSRVLICLNWFCRFFSVSHSEAINVHFSLFIIPARPTGDMFRMRWVQSAVCVWCGWMAWWQSTIWLMESSFGHTFIGSNCCIYPAFFFFLLPLNAWWFCVNYNVLLLGGPSGELREIWWYHRIMMLDKHLRIIMPAIKDILGTFTMEKWVADCVHKVCVSFDLLSQLTAR